MPPAGFATRVPDTLSTCLSFVTIASRLLSAERDHFHLILTVISSDGNNDYLPFASEEAKDSHSRFPGTLLLMIGGAGLELLSRSGF